MESYRTCLDQFYRMEWLIMSESIFINFGETFLIISDTIIRNYRITVFGSVLEINTSIFENIGT